MAKVSGSFNVKSADTTATLAVSAGKITVEGKPVQIFASENPRFPADAGWFAIVQANGAMAVSRVTKETKLEVVTIKGSKVTPATLTEEETAPAPETPKDGKCYSQVTNSD